MKKHSSKNPNRVYQFTLTKQGEKILEAFAAKYGTTKSVIVDRALMFLAGQYHRKIVISYELLSENENTTTTTTEPGAISIMTSINKHNSNMNYEIMPNEIADIRYGYPDAEHKQIVYGSGKTEIVPMEKQV